ncbi:hypothetical protein ACU5EH_00720 [Aliivibrio salmonicida]|uniref:Uncharacterized protein n=1 Tax=Aliivibrio fischeri TaxID=668 RepID=A0A844P8N9_ALIFS|nr:MULTISPECIES: hypothetical protein [Aliivibrio]MUK51477.1 hypothetical protein [Aliivibrio fischeri]OCH23946.1 hypothetical protein A6E03_19310 [Aliivibrio sp. 1S128]
MKITDFMVFDENGEELLADPNGNNVAFKCWKCDHPVLAIALLNQRGFDEKHPAKCRGCNALYALDVREKMEKLYIYEV